MAMGGIKSKRLEAVLVGGNHLASSLIKHAGPDFAERLPPRTHPDDAMAVLFNEHKEPMATVLYDMWVCWAAIMNARHLMGDRTGKPAKVYTPCTTCAGEGKVRLSQPPHDARAVREVMCTICKGHGRNVVVQ